MLERVTATVTGVRASTRAAKRAAVWPAARRTVAWRTPTAATPMSACGRRIDQLEKPKRRAESTGAQSASGGLSTVMKFAASREPKNIAFQLFVPARTAVA